MQNAAELDVNLDESKTSEPEVVLTAAEEATMKSMIENNVFYGHLKSRTNPKMKPSIISTKNGVEVIDLTKTMKAIEKASAVLKEKAKMGGLILFVGTTPASKFVTKEVADRLQMPYVNERWLGGTLTNFKTILTRINYFRKLEDDRATGKLQKYTKKERAMIDVELLKLERLFRGVVGLDRLPAAVVITDLGYSDIAAQEAALMRIPAISLVNTSSDPELVKYPIPANDRNSKSVAFILYALEKAIAEGKAAKSQAETAKMTEKPKTTK